MQTTPLNTAGGPQSEDEIDLQRYTRFLTAHWIVLLGCALAGAVLALGVASFIPPRFQSTATLMIVQPPGTTPLVLTAGTAKAVLVNPAIVSETINELGLNHDGVTTQRFIDDSLEVDPVAATNVVRVSVTLPDPTKARLAAALLARKVMDLSARIGRETPSVSRAPLERQLAEADRQMKDAEERLVKFQSSADRGAVAAETTSKLTRRADVDGRRAELYRGRLELARLQAEYKARSRMYFKIWSKYQDNVQAESTPQLQIIAPPVQPDQPLPRRRRQYATLGGLIGLVCGVVAAFVIDGRNISNARA